MLGVDPTPLLSAMSISPNTAGHAGIPHTNPSLTFDQGSTDSTGSHSLGVSNLNNLNRSISAAPKGEHDILEYQPHHLRHYQPAPDPDHDEGPPNPFCPRAVRWPIVVAIAFALVSIYFNCLMQVVNERRSELLHRLPDLGHTALPYIDNPWDALALADLAVIVVVVPVVLRTLLSAWRWTILKRWILLLGFLFLLRGCTVVLTSLPPPRIDCELQKDTGRSVWFEALLIIIGVSRTCRDLVFSGHTVNLTLAALVVLEYSHLNPITSFDPAYGDFRVRHST